MLIKILLARTNAIYKTNAENTTSRQPIAKQRIAKSPNPNGSRLLRFNFARYIFFTYRLYDYMLGKPLHTYRHSQI